MTDKTINDLTALTASATADELALWDADVVTTKKITVANFFKIPNADGVDVNPGSDADADLITVGVTGTPKLWWDESDNALVAEVTVDGAAYWDIRSHMDSAGNGSGLRFWAEDAGDAAQLYGALIADIVTATAASEAGRFIWQLTRAGTTDKQAMVLTGGGDETTTLDLYSEENSALTAAGTIRFYGHDSGAADQDYAQISGVVVVSTAGSESGELQFKLTRSGAVGIQAMRLVGGGDETTNLDLYSREDTDGASVAALRFRGRDDGAGDTFYAQIDGYIVDNAAGSEDGGLWLKALNNNSMTEVAEFSATGGALQIGFFGVAAQAQQAHIIDADGQLADITTKFNTLLADLEGYGLLASA